jgi:glycosyltransferase involved in cell wall biosynthesis
MLDSGANTAIVAALACGVPVVTTDVGGIRDYGGGTLFPLARAGSVEDVVELAARYITDRAYRELVGALCREFAERTLRWECVARRHLDAYLSLSR